MSLLYLIRHAQASFGQADYDRLSELGQEQARVLALHLDRIGAGFDAIYLGSQLRHDQTLEAYRKVCSQKGNELPPVCKNDFFNEYDAGSILRTFIPILVREEPGFKAQIEQMTTSNRSFEKVFEKVLCRWFDHEGEADDFESWAHFSSRVQRGIRQIMDREGSGKRVAVFTSGGPICAVVQKALGLSKQSTISIALQIANSSISRFKYNGEAVTLFGFNDITHLELDDPERLITYR